MAVKLKNMLNRSWHARVGGALEPFQPLESRPFPDERAAECKDAAEKTYPGRLSFEGHLPTPPVSGQE